MQALLTSVETSSSDLVKAIHAAGHRIVLVDRGPRRYTYHTSASQAEIAQCGRGLTGGSTIQAIPGGTPGYR